MWSVALQANVVTFYFLISQALSLQIAYPNFYLIVPIVVLVMMMPVSINGIGTRESAFVILLGTFGVGVAEAVAFAWIEHALFLSYGLVGGVVYALRHDFIRVSPSAQTDL